jgi:hypothetical protein
MWEFGKSEAVLYLGRFGSISNIYKAKRKNPKVLNSMYNTHIFM